MTRIRRSKLRTGAPITAILYSEGRDVDPLMARIASDLARYDLALAGFVQLNQPRAGRRRCDMVLEELASGERIGISEDRGPHARGCHLDVGELLRGLQLARAALADAPDLLVINKFGKTEGEGGGFRPLIADALAIGVPVLIATPWRNIDGWRRFSEGLAREVRIEDLSADPSGLLSALGFSVGAATSSGVFAARAMLPP
jgi:hypothetical protein